MYTSNCNSYLFHVVRKRVSWWPGAVFDNCACAILEELTATITTVIFEVIFSFTIIRAGAYQHMIIMSFTCLNWQKELLEKRLDFETCRNGPFLDNLQWL